MGIHLLRIFLFALNKVNQWSGFGNDSVKSQILNLGFANDKFSVVPIQLWGKIIDKTEINKHDYVLIKLYLHKQVRGQIWLLS